MLNTSIIMLPSKILNLRSLNILTGCGGMINHRGKYYFLIAIAGILFTCNIYFIFYKPNKRNPNVNVSFTDKLDNLRRTSASYATIATLRAGSVSGNNEGTLTYSVIL